MKAVEIKVTNFRSIVKQVVPTTLLNIFVGQNNHGKTNFFEAINWFYYGKGDPLEMSHKRNGGVIEVEIKFDGVQDAISSMKNEKNKATLQSKLLGQTEISVLRRSTEKKRLFLNPASGQFEDPGSGFDKAIDDLLPRFEYVPTSMSLTDVAKYTKTSPIGLMLSGVLMALLETNLEYQAFKEKFDSLFGADTSDVKVQLDVLGEKVKVYLQKQFPDCTEVEFQVSQPEFEELLKNFETAIDDGVRTDATEKGDGMQRALMLAIIQSYADFRKTNEDIGKSFMFLIDEGELHLHPSAQRQLKKALIDISNQGDQVFLNTHSSVLVVDDSAGQSILKVEKISGETDIDLIDGIGRQSVIYDLLGGSPSDLLLPRNFLIVEGPTELILLENVLRRFYSDKPVIQIIPAGGDHIEIEKTKAAIEKVLAPLYGSPIYGDKLVVFCDAPHPTRVADFNAFEGRHSKLKSTNRLFVSPAQFIEAAYPPTWQKTAAQLSGLDKKKLAKEVGLNISKGDFETSLKTVFNALEKCWAEAYA